MLNKRNENRRYSIRRIKQRKKEIKKRRRLLYMGHSRTGRQCYRYKTINIFFKGNLISVFFPYFPNCKARRFISTKKVPFALFSR